MSDTPSITRRLGRLPVRHDRRTLHLADYLRPDRLPDPPAACDWLSAVTEWPVYLNDQLGCCTCAAMGHMVQAWTQYAAGDDVAVTDDDVLAAYEAVSGYDPATGEHDEGAVELDVLRYWRTVGIGGHRIGAFVKIDHKDLREVRQAVHLFGGIYVGFEVSQSAMGQINTGQLWDSARTRAGRQILGGHAIPVGRYDAHTLTCVTWGQTQAMTEGFWRDYVDEAYAVVSTDWLDPRTDTSPSGLDTAALAADLRAIGA